MVESCLERLHQSVDLGLATHQVGGSGARRGGLGGAGYRLGPLRLDRMEEAIAAPYDGLDNALADGAPHIAEVGAENAVAHHDLPPYDVDELLLGHQALRVLRQILQDRERLAPEVDLLAFLEEALLADVEPEGAEQANFPRASICHGRTTMRRVTKNGQ